MTDDTRPLTCQLILDDDDFGLKEPGFELSLAGSKAWARSTEVDPNLTYEEVTKSILLTPDQDFSNYPNPVLSQWSLYGGSEWEIAPLVPAFDGASALFHRSAQVGTRVSATRVASWSYNPSCMVGMYLFQPNTPDNWVSLQWGSNPSIRLTLQPGWVPLITLNDETDWPITKIPPLSVDDFYMKALRLWVYFIRDTMVVYSNFMKTFSWRPSAAVLPEQTYNDGICDHVYLPGPGNFWIEAVGMFYFNAVKNAYYTPGMFFNPFNLPYEPTTEVATDYWFEPFAASNVLLELRKEDDSGDYEDGDQTGAVKMTLSCDSPHEETPYVYSYKANWPSAVDTTEGAKHQPDVLTISETRTWDANADTIRLLIVNNGEVGELQRTGNRRLTVSVDDIRRFTGYLDEVTLEYQDTLECFRLTARDSMRKLQHAELQSDFNADGYPPEEAIKELIIRAGVSEGEIRIAVSDYTMESSDNQLEPANLFTGGTNVMDACQSIMESWLKGWRFYADPYGVYVVEPWVKGSPKYTFYFASDDGVDDIKTLIEDYAEWSDDEDLINWLVVHGVDKNGEVICVTRKDTESWTNKDSPTYVGEIRNRKYVDQSLMTTENLDIVADRLFTEGDRIRHFYKWRSYVNLDLFPGDVVTLDQIGDVKLTDVDAEYSEMLGMATYTAEEIYDEAEQ